MFWWRTLDRMESWRRNDDDDDDSDDNDDDGIVVIVMLIVAVYCFIALSYASEKAPDL